MVLAVAGTPAAAQTTFDQSRSSSFTYFVASDGAKNGLLKTETIEPGNSQLCVTTTYDYDAYGNKSSATTANCAGTDANARFVQRQSQSLYAAQTITVAGVSVSVPVGTFATTATNALAQSDNKLYDPRFGAAVSLTGPNALTTTWTVDDFGRVVTETRADGTRTFKFYCFIGAQISDLTSNSASCPSPGAGEVPQDAVAFVHTEPRDAAGNQIGPFSRVYTDKAGRQIRSVAQAFDGPNQPGGIARLVVQDVDYSVYGQQLVATQPYFLDSGSSTSTGVASISHYGMRLTEYDVLGRAVAVYNTDVTATSTVGGNQGGNSGGQRGGVKTFPGRGDYLTSKTTLAYAGLNSTSTDDAMKTRTEEKNVDGKVVRVTDALGAQVAYQHDAFGNLLTTKDALQNLVQVAYDVRGRKVSMADPDSGVWGYCYDALGQLVAQQNSKMRGSDTPSACPSAPNNSATGGDGLTANAVANWTTMAYDTLGRLKNRVEPEYSSTWTYDTYSGGATCNKGVGKLCEVNSSNGVNRKTEYDNIGRPLNSRTTIASGPSFASSVVYDGANGRVLSQIYPTGLKVNYGYTGKGFLNTLSMGTTATVTPLPSTVGGTPVAGTTLSSGTVLWQANAYNAWGNAEQQNYSNGVVTNAFFDPSTGRVTNLTAGVGAATNVLNYSYVWDSIGRVAQRTDQNGGASDSPSEVGAVTDVFTYDGIGRLNGYIVNAPGVPNSARTVSIQYNAIGMTLYKSDVGNYVYGAQATAGVRPHALQSVAGAVTTNYGYDANGNMISASAGKYRTLSYTSFNLPDSNTGAQGPGGLPKYTWQYDENHQRIKEAEVTSTGTRTTWILHPDNQGGLAFESESSTSSPTPTNRHYLSVGGVSIGVLVSNGALPTLTASQMAPPVLSTITVVKVEYWHKDQLGSLMATTDHQGNVTQGYSYDPFGKRRVLAGRYDDFGALVFDWTTNTNKGTDRGYTGHEHLDDIGIVHMNGRTFDPTLGRFMQGDPLIQDPLNLQNYDRYGYCFNNPLTCTDPSGMDFFGSFKRSIVDGWKGIWGNPVGRIVVVAIVSYVTYGIGSDAAVSALASTETAATTGYSAATINAVGNFGGSVAAGFAGGFVASGGSFKSGAQGAFSAGAFFLAGEFIGGAGGIFNTEGVGSPLGQVAVHGVVGCVTSVASGTRCGPGFASAALSKAAFAFDLVPEGNIAGFVTATVLGGTASVITGGKFENGAITAGFGYLFNYCLHSTADCWMQRGMNALKVIGGGTGFVVGIATCGATVGLGCLAAIESGNQIIDGVTYFTTPGAEEGFKPSKVILQQAFGETNGAHINTAFELGAAFQNAGAPLALKTFKLFNPDMSTRIQQMGATQLTITVGGTAGKLLGDPAYDFNKKSGP